MKVHTRVPARVRLIKILRLRSARLSQKEKKSRSEQHSKTRKCIYQKINRREKNVIFIFPICSPVYRVFSLKPTGTPIKNYKHENTFKPTEESSKLPVSSSLNNTKKY